MDKNWFNNFDKIHSIDIFLKENKIHYMKNYNGNKIEYKLYSMDELKLNTIITLDFEKGIFGYSIKDGFIEDKINEIFNK